MVTGLQGIIPEILKPRQGYTPDTPVTGMMFGIKCHKEQTATSHISVVGATS